MDEVYIRTDDLAKFVKQDYFDNRDFITLEDFYRAFEQLSSDYESLQEKYQNCLETKSESEEYY